jgi:hypothetical protein
MKMMPDEKLDHDQYVEWMLLRATKFYAMRMGAGVRGRERHDCATPLEAVLTAERLSKEAGRQYLVYGSWDMDLRCELVSKKLCAAIKAGTFVPFVFSPDGAPEGTWEPEEAMGTRAEAQWLAEEESKSLHGGVNMGTYYP